MLLVLGAGVLGLGHGGELGLRGEVGEVALGLLEVEDEGLGVRRLDGLQAVPALVLVGPLIVLAADQPVPQVRCAAREFTGEGALDPVLDVGAGDRRPVLVRESVLEFVRPDLGVLAGRAQVRGEVGDDLGAGGAVRAVAGGEGAEDEGGDVAAAGGVEAGRVEVALRVAVEDGERAALLRGAGRAARLGVAGLLGTAGRHAADQGDSDGGGGRAARYEGQLTHG